MFLYFEGRWKWEGREHRVQGETSRRTALIMMIIKGGCVRSADGEVPSRMVCTDLEIHPTKKKKVAETVQLFSINGVKVVKVG